MGAYARLAASFARMATLGEASAMLGWDAAAMMPRGGAAARADQLALLAAMGHDMLLDPALAEALDAAEAAPPADPWEAANLGLMRHAHARATALPADLVEARSRANSACETIWREARPAADFALVRPALERVVALARETADAIGGALDLSPYDALMDGYQRGIGVAEVAPVFDRLQGFLADALPRAESRQAALPPPCALPAHYPEAVQALLCRELSATAGLDFDHARLDRSAHPFCGGIPSDLRITTRYDEADAGRALMGVLHETGHALYERGLPASQARQPVGEAAGMAAHESQSLLIEMQACRSDAYLSWLGPKLHGAFGGTAAVWAPGNLARHWRRIARGFMRVDADEMTYPLHVILRFRLERALIGGDLAVADLPGAWAEASRALLGVAPPDDRRGCLQDIHWYDGAFGYFPSYTLGALAAAQLMAAARRDVPGLDDALGRGDFSSLLGWLRARVHGQGSRFGFNDLLRHATGKTLDPADFEAHLAARYL